MLKNKAHRAIRHLSDRIVAAQRPIRILDAIKWDEKIKKQFFRDRAQKLPNIDPSYYRPLSFNAEESIAAFRHIIADIHNTLDIQSHIAQLMMRMCDEYIKTIQMLTLRGTPGFSALARELYGAPQDDFYPGGPRLTELSATLEDILKALVVETESTMDVKCYSASEAVVILQERLSPYFQYDKNVIVRLSDHIVADAAAGANCIKLNPRVRFSERDLRYLEVHEGWVHVGTTRNGMAQPICTFLSKGPPSSSVTQEGLAVLTEMITFSSYPQRMLTITNRVTALDLVDRGANFIDIFRFFRQQGHDEQNSYYYTVRVFRGSTPDGGAFTKDLSYTKGFVLIYNYIRVAIQENTLDHIPLFFAGKIAIDNVSTIHALTKQGLIAPPVYVPPQFQDLAALSSWLAFLLFLSRFDLAAVASHQKNR